MSQPSTQTSPTKTSPQKPSPSKSTTTTPNITENPSVPLPQPSDVITNATPLTMIHPSFNSILNPTPSNPSPSPKSKPTKNTKSVTTRKPKSQKSKSRYSSNFDMQQLYLSDLGNARTNVASDVATPCPDVQIEANKEDSTQTLSPKKGETAKMGEKYVPNTPSDEGDDEDAQNIKIAEDALKSLVDSVSGVKVVPDVPTSLAQDQPQDDVMDDSNVQQNDDIATDVTGDPSVQPDEIVADDVLAEDTDQVDDTEEEGVNEDDSTDEDVTILEIVGESKKRSGKTGVGNRLRTRKEEGYSEFEPTDNQICKTITANQVKVWPLKGKVPSVMLSVKYAILNRIGAINWVPTTHSSTIATSLAKFIYAIGTGADADFGSLIFDQIVEHGKSWAVKLVTAFTTIICGIILDQHPNILLPEDVPCKRDSPMTLSYKLFEGKHAADIIVPPKKVVPQENIVSTSMNRKAMIISMEAAVKALDEQKIELEKVILALKQKEAEEEGLVAENAGVNDAGDGVDAADGDAAGNEEEGGDKEELEVSDSSGSF
ncbi:hypothetical protein QL285_080233 [Trifolium repens]|nr:hypothetical protein QL285_080233 [Trifolium repens]